MTENLYNDLAERRERGELEVKPGTVLRGSAAAEGSSWNGCVRNCKSQEHKWGVGDSLRLVSS